MGWSIVTVSCDKSIVEIWTEIGYKYGKSLNLEKEPTSEKNGWRMKRLPQVPILIPLIVAGVFLGNVWSTKDLTAVWKKAILMAAVSGILNAAYAWVLGYLNISKTGLLPSVSGQTSVTSNNFVFMASCGIAAFLIVVTVYLSALGMMRYRRGKTLEPKE